MTSLTVEEWSQLANSLAQQIQTDETYLSLLEQGILTEVNSDKDTYELSDSEEDTKYFIYMVPRTKPSAELVNDLKSLVEKYFTVTDAFAELDEDSEDEKYTIVFIIKKGVTTL